MANRKSDEDKRITAQLKLARRAAARAADPDYRARANAYQRASYERNLAANRVRNAEWAKANRVPRRAQQSRRRGRIAGASGTHTAAQLAMILANQGDGCAYCGARGPLHLDHATPLSRGGGNDVLNLQYLCAPHNLAKGDRTDAEYRRMIGLPERLPLTLRLWCAAMALG